MEAEDLIAKSQCVHGPGFDLECYKRYKGGTYELTGPAYEEGEDASVKGLSVRKRFRVLGRPCIYFRPHGRQ